MRPDFASLATNDINRRMRPQADVIYRQLFKGCEIERLDSSGAHPLDKHFGIDVILRLASGCIVTVQEKFRAHRWMRYLDFTQEYLNAAGTPFEEAGEWGKLAADLYLYGWADAGGDRLAKWAMLDVLKYKLYVEQSGGLDVLGEYKHNSKHGRASFYAIPMESLEPVFFADYRQYASQAAD